ncbi:metal ABC transporter ATP-binding protein [Ilumatobacter sp.]|uniref:metal ABC transporter ATP-binding protein n=1 Tax=Ilumatobacter sp. TaxID=1967498 RepID=UPI003C63E36A
MGIIPETTTHGSDGTDHDDLSVADLVVVRGRATVLEIESLRIPHGYTALVGPNGSGKTTLLDVFAGLIEPRRGTVEFGMCAPGERLPRLAYVLQSQPASEQLLVTAGEVVALARSSQRGLFGRLTSDDRTMIDAAMERLDVAHLAHRHLAEMSGGQRQRVFIAQGLAQDADVLLLDEPVAGLDLASMQTIREAIDDECAAGRTVVVATHDLEEAARADTVVMLNGRVVASGPPADVLRAENLREAYRGRVIEIADGVMTVDDDHHH